MRRVEGSASADGRTPDGADELDEDADENEETTKAKQLNKRVVRKLDLLLLPFLSLFFLVNSLDRSNIGNAETANFTTDAGLAPGDLNTATACFFAFFVALQPVGAACGRYFGMRRWVPSCMVVWGCLTASHVWINAKWQLVLVRILIGILEAGFYPVTVSYLSLFYTRYEFARRLGIFYGQYAIAGAVGGVLAYAVFSAFPYDDSGRVLTSSTYAYQDWRPWQVLFLLEGLLTVIIAMIGFLWLPDSAETSWFFNTAERRWASARIERDRGVSQNISGANADSIKDTISHDEVLERTGGAEAETLLHDGSKLKDKSSQTLTYARGLTILDIVDAFTDWKVWYLLVANILSAVPAAAFTVFLPLIVKGFAFSSVSANLFTAPPFLLGAIVLWIFTWWSDRRKERLIPILYGLAILLTGLTGVVMLPHAWHKSRYAALCILLGGSFVASPLTIAWFTGNIEAPGKRAVVLGINGWGNLAGVFSSLLFAPTFAPDYQTPFFVTLALVMVSFTGFMLFRKLLVEENKSRGRITEAWSTSTQVEEACYGTAAYPGRKRSTWLARLLGRYGDHVEEQGRRGEERLTFEYSL